MMKSCICLDHLTKRQVAVLKKIRILGIDPGYAIVGFGVLDYDGVNFSPIEYGAVLTEAGVPFPERLRAIHEDIEFIFNKFKPDCMAIERLYFTTNQKTAIDVAQARGITVLSAAIRDVPVSEYTPLQVKLSVTGYGDDQEHSRTCTDTQARRCRRCSGDSSLSRTHRPLAVA